MKTLSFLDVLSNIFADGLFLDYMELKSSFILGFFTGKFVTRTFMELTTKWLIKELLFYYPVFV